MTTKKTTAKKAASKRATKKESLPIDKNEKVIEGHIVLQDKTSGASNLENANAISETTKVPASTEGAIPQPVKRKEPVQGVRDARTHKNDDIASEETKEIDASDQKNSEKLVVNEQSQQPKNRNRRTRRNRPKNEHLPAQKTQPSSINTKELSKRAWKIFLGEVSEEGLALIGDKEGRELSKRSFRLAEIFLEEQARRTASKGQRRRPQSNNTSELIEDNSTNTDAGASPEIEIVSEVKQEVESSTNHKVE